MVSSNFQCTFEVFFFSFLVFLSSLSLFFIVNYVGLFLELERVEDGIYNSQVSVQLFKLYYFFILYYFICFILVLKKKTRGFDCINI